MNIEVLDGVLAQRAPEFKEKLCSWKVFETYWTPKQGNDFDCGLFVVKMMQASQLGPGYRIQVNKHTTHVDSSEKLYSSSLDNIVYLMKRHCEMQDKIEDMRREVVVNLVIIGDNMVRDKIIYMLQVLLRVKA
ncbi:unnamed protein product [Ilex paraguariensis]|uniref:Ubiquitin-like protease family profile domain-containing protein n=1 Tax=Ilex paraguariensis TaxID=185542 RepID=A0ABC8SLX7_9AQUA